MVLNSSKRRYFDAKKLQHFAIASIIHSFYWFIYTSKRFSYFGLNPLSKRQFHRMVKHTQTIRRQFVGNLPTNCLSVSGKFVGLALKGLTKLKVISTKKTLFVIFLFRCNWWLLFTREKDCVSFSRYLDFCVFHESANFKLCYVIMNITTYYKMYLYEDEIWGNVSITTTNIFITFLVWF